MICAATNKTSPSTRFTRTDLNNGRFNGQLPISHGGTGASTPEGAREALGITGAGTGTSDIQYTGVTTNGTATEIFINGEANNRLTLDDQDCFGFEAHVVARRTDADNEGAYWVVKGAIDRNGAATALLGGTLKETIADDSGEVWDITISADDVNDAIKVTVTGEAAKTVSWRASVKQILVSG